MAGRKPAPRAARGARGRRGRKASATYAYCLVAAAQAPEVAAVPAGLAGAGPARTLAAGRGRWLVVADAPLSAYSADAVNGRLSDLDWVGARAIEHERVIEHFAGAGTVVPMKLFTLFTSDAKAVANVKGRRGLASLIAALHGREEWGVRVSIDPGRLRRHAADVPAPSPKSMGEGTGFLVRRQREQRAVRDGMADAQRRADEAFAALEPLASDARRREPAGVDGATLLLDAAFLVDRGRAGAFTDAARDVARRHSASGLNVVLTGPWPPYNFLAAAGKAR